MLAPAANVRNWAIAALPVMVSFGVVSCRSAFGSNVGITACRLSGLAEALANGWKWVENGHWPSPSDRVYLSFGERSAVVVLLIATFPIRDTLPINRWAYKLVSVIFFAIYRNVSIIKLTLIHEHGTSCVASSIGLIWDDAADRIVIDL